MSVGSVLVSGSVGDFTFDILFSILIYITIVTREIEFELGGSSVGEAGGPGGLGVLGVSVVLGVTREIELGGSSVRGEFSG